MKHTTIVVKMRHIHSVVHNVKISNCYALIAGGELNRKRGGCDSLLVIQKTLPSKYLVISVPFGIMPSVVKLLVEHGADVKSLKHQSNGDSVLRAG